METDSESHISKRTLRENKRQVSWIRVASCVFLINALGVVFILIFEQGSVAFELKHTLVGVFGVSSIVLLFILSCCGIPNERLKLVAIFGLCVAFYIFGIGTDTIARRIGHSVHNKYHHH